MTRLGERGVATSATLVGPGLAIRENIVYRLDSSLPAGSEIGRGDTYGRRGEECLWNGDEVLVAANVFNDLFAPRPELAAPVSPVRQLIYVNAACTLLGVSRASIDRLIAACPEKHRPASWGAGDGGKSKRARRRWYWPDEEALRAWWARCDGSGPAKVAALPRSRRAKSAKTSDDDVVDWSAQGREARRRG